MFTGLVQDCGRVLNLAQGKDSARISIHTRLANEISEGDSVSVNGVCRTAVRVDDASFDADVMVQTLRLTSLGVLVTDSPVNLELAARSDGRLGGHIVQGHVDGVAKVVTIEPGEKWQKFVVEIPHHLAKYIVNQGSITLDGVSLTVGDIDDLNDHLTVWLIPETLAKTNLSSRKLGDLVNVEVDVLAKYVERLIAHKKNDEEKIYGDQS